MTLKTKLEMMRENVIAFRIDLNYVLSSNGIYNLELTFKQNLVCWTTRNIMALTKLEFSMNPDWHLQSRIGM